MANDLKGPVPREIAYDITSINIKTLSPEHIRLSNFLKLPMLLDGDGSVELNLLRYRGECQYCVSIKTINLIFRPAINNNAFENMLR